MDRGFCFFILFSLTSTIAAVTAGDFIGDSSRLLDDLFTDNYKKEVIPITAIGKPLSVFVNMTFVRIEDLNEEDDVFTVGVFFVQMWNDTRLKWDAAEYGNISFIRIPSSKIWTPDITLYNGATDSVESSHAENVHVMNTGLVYWFPQLTFKAHCAMDFGRYPFDMQKCHLALGSWMYMSLDINFQFSDYFGQNPVNKSDVPYHPYANEASDHPQWEFVNKKGSGNIFKSPVYGTDIMFEVIAVEVVLKRRPDFYRYIIIGPSVIMAVMIPILFLLPPRATEKTIYGLGILIAHLLLMFLLQDQIPFDHSSVPRLDCICGMSLESISEAKYHLITMILASLSVAVSVFVIYLAEKGRYKKTVPAWVHKLFLSRRGVRWLLCVDSMRPIDRFYSSLTSRNFEDYPDGEPDADGAQELDPVTNRDNKQLRAIQKSLQAILSKFSADEAYENVQREWEELAIIVDRICFILFYFIFVIASFSMMSSES